MDFISIERIEPTVCIRQGLGSLEQRIDVVLVNSSEETEVILAANGQEHQLVCPPGESTTELFQPLPRNDDSLTVEVRSAERVLGYAQCAWQPPRRWTVHVVQLSHHDAGYTDLASQVLLEQDRWLDRLVDFSRETADYPEAARFRAVIEQGWSLLHYLRRAPEERRHGLLELLRRGDIEVSALFGNMVTELCDDETLIRALYSVAELSRQHGFRVRTAEHNDIPGFCWGLSEALVDAGVEMFCPGLPTYYNWGHDWPSFWDDAAIFGRKDVPGAFWWQTPAGKRLLVWCNNRGCGGSSDPAMPDLPRCLRSYELNGYPGNLLRWPVVGASRDNSPYIRGFADTIKGWNERWEWPRLICSTNSRFLDDLLPTLPEDLPVHHGGLPGQDYPSGAMSTARASATARYVQAGLPVAEQLACTAMALAGHTVNRSRLNAAWEALLWHCEHTWGYHFPAGPVARTAELEKAVHAHRADALTQEIANKAAACLADSVRLTRDAIHLVVFNPSPWQRTDRVRHPLREIDNCGGELVTRLAGEQEPGAMLRPAILNNRWPVHPPLDLAAGHFRLIDVQSGATVPFQVLPVSDALGDVVDAAQRVGLGSGTRRLGHFDEPLGLAHDLCFVANDVPAGGWRTYRMEADQASPSTTYLRQTTLENAHYRIGVQPETGTIRSIIDKQVERELVASYAEYPFGSLIVVDPQGRAHLSALTAIHPMESGPVLSRLRLEYAAPGHPRIQLTLVLWHDLPVIEIAAHVLKAPDPLFSVHLAFTFAIAGGRFTVDEALTTIDPAHDRLPGAYLNRLACRNWVRLGDSTSTLYWSSLDSPIFSLGRLWPSRMSPAHTCVVDARYSVSPQVPEDLAGGAIFSTLYMNNVGTNFAVSQEGSCLFRYVIASTAAASVHPDTCNRFGASARHPLTAIYTRHEGNRTLPPTSPWLQISDSCIQVVTLKPALDGNGFILRLRNSRKEPVSAGIRFVGSPLQWVQPVSITEAPLDTPELPLEGDGFNVTLGPRDILTLRVCLPLD